jgi:predicted peptidase
MDEQVLMLVEEGPLPYLLSLPRIETRGDVWPLLFFLHGYDEGAPTPPLEGLMRHGPLAASAWRETRERFIVVAPQLPRRGDYWSRYSQAVREIVVDLQRLHPVDPSRCWLTGFSFGGNGVLDLALHQADLWAALWPVDPTRVPTASPERPLWLSSGQASRSHGQAFIERLELQPLGKDGPGERVYRDAGLDHVNTAREAYADERIYRWLDSSGGVVT